MKELDGQKLLSVEANPTDGPSRFRFDLGSDLLTWPPGDENEEQWSLRTPGRSAISYRADGHYSLGPTDPSPDEEVWIPLPPKPIVCALA